MADATARRSPLEGLDLPAGLREMPYLAQVDLRLDPSDDAARAAVESVVGLLPIVPNTFTGDGAGAVLWLGPDEWLVVGPPDGAEAVVAQLHEALGENRGRVAIIDVSANRTTLELTGPQARRALEGGCPIDLHPHAFGSGRCAQTLVARANVVLQQLGDEPTYRLYVRPSFAAYLGAWLSDAVLAAHD